MRQLSALLILVLMLSLAAMPAMSEEVEMKTIYFAGGCWGVEHMMELVPGVVDAVTAMPTTLWTTPHTARWWAGIPGTGRR